jgi:hypothetical protein
MSSTSIKYLDHRSSTLVTPLKLIHSNRDLLIRGDELAHPALAPGLTPRAVIEKMASIQMIEVHLPTTDGRQVILSRYTEPEKSGYHSW